MSSFSWVIVEWSWCFNPFPVPAEIWRGVAGERKDGEVSVRTTPGTRTDISASWTSAGVCPVSESATIVIISHVYRFLWRLSSDSFICFSSFCLFLFLSVCLVYFFLQIFVSFVCFLGLSLLSDFRLYLLSLSFVRFLNLFLIFFPYVCFFSLFLSESVCLPLFWTDLKKHRR